MRHYLYTKTVTKQYSAVVNCLCDDDAEFLKEQINDGDCYEGEEKSIDETISLVNAQEPHCLSILEAVYIDGDLDGYKVL